MTIRKPGGSRIPKPAKEEAGQQRKTRLASALRQNLHRRKAQKSARKSDESVKSGGQENDKGSNQS
jgi:hypothetical protein